MTACDWQWREFAWLHAGLVFLKDPQTAGSVSSQARRAELGRIVGQALAACCPIYITELSRRGKHFPAGQTRDAILGTVTEGFYLLPNRAFTGSEDAFYGALWTNCCRILAGPSPILREITKAAYDHWRYIAKRRGDQTERWSTELRDWLVQQRMAEMLGGDPAGTDELALGGIEFDRVIESLSPSKQQTLVRMLAGEPTTGEADRKRRSRLRETLQTELSQS